MKTIYHNAVVYTGDLPLRRAFVVEDGVFTFVGSDAEALAMGGAAVDLGGAFVCAGFNDSHMHLLNYGQTLCITPLGPHTGSLADLLEALRRDPRGRGGWILGRGWNQDFFSDVHRMPTRQDLDTVSRTAPIAITRACGHALCVNTRALELLGIDASTPQPEGGQIVMENGEPNGIFLDNAMALVNAAIPAPGPEDLKAMLLAACRALNSRGITSVQSDDYALFPGVSWPEVNRAYRELEEEGLLTVRVSEQANLWTTKRLTAFLDAGLNTGVGSDLFRIGPLKIVADGALGARTAYLSRPYADAPETRGFPLLSQQELDGLIGLAHERGMQVAVHAIGDACLDMVLGSFQKALAAHPRRDHRHGIVHCQITRPDQLERIAALDLHVYAQSIFLDYDTTIVRPRAGDALAASSYSWKTLLKKGVHVSNGSDCPVELPNVLGGIQCAVTRRSLSGGEVYLPEEAFTVQEALDSFTQAGARAEFQEGRKGRIRPGMLADFVVLGGDPFAVDPAKLNTIPVLATYLGGRRVYGDIG